MKKTETADRIVMQQSGEERQQWTTTCENESEINEKRRYRLLQWTRLMCTEHTLHSQFYTVIQK